MYNPVPSVTDIFSDAQSEFGISQSTIRLLQICLLVHSRVESLTGVHIKLEDGEARQPLRVNGSMGIT